MLSAKDPRVPWQSNVLWDVGAEQKTHSWKQPTMPKDGSYVEVKDYLRGSEVERTCGLSELLQLSYRGYTKPTVMSL